MRASSKVEIIDITEDVRYERYLYRCLAPMPFRKYKKRREYLEAAIPKGFHKKLLILDGKIVGQIEHASAEVCGYPITGAGIIVINCVWVLRKAKGHNFGRQLLADMIHSEKEAVGFATIALENHWSPWFKRWQMEKFGFEPVDSIEVTHKTKHRGERFKIHLMWLPETKKAKPPVWDEPKLLEGEDFCLAHPLYHPEKTRLREILEKC
jgi:N-acetylglutamate synthase-like GNAT family acetyltransferase